MTTKIEWAEDVWNPLRAILPKPEWGSTGWHCERVSAGCQHCYAETLNVAQRFGNGTGLPYNRKSRDLVKIELHEDTLLKPLHWRKPRRVFVCSMTDLFGEWVPDEYLDRMFAVMALAPQHQFLVLTKRPERMREYMTSPERAEAIGYVAYDVWEDSGLPANGDVASALIRGGAACTLQEASSPWPLPNVWLGVSAEDQETADQRIPVLLETPAAVRFVSLEPLLGRILLDNGESSWLTCNGLEDTTEGQGCISYHSCGRHFHGIDWVIVGGESGPGARPCNMDWIRSVVKQCQAAKVACFVKQMGNRPEFPDSDHALYSSGEIPVRFEGDSSVFRLKDRKGGDMAEWPEDLRVREMPR